MKVYIFCIGMYDDYEKYLIVSNEKEEAIKRMVDFVNDITLWKDKKVVIELDNVVLYWGENGRNREEYTLTDEFDFALDTVY